jgi:hypothetical protein
MLQIDPRSAMNLDNMSTGGHHARRLPARPLEEKSKQRQASGVKGMGITLIERVLPRARDRVVTIHADALLTEAAESPVRAELPHGRRLRPCRPHDRRDHEN